jgi:hypothetical protein
LSWRAKKKNRVSEFSLQLQEGPSRNLKSPTDRLAIGSQARGSLSLGWNRDGRGPAGRRGIEQDEIQFL